jgi:acetyltransferase-like isoleucine patch superfamily enzyme
MREAWRELIVAAFANEKFDPGDHAVRRARRGTGQRRDRAGCALPTRSRRSFDTGDTGRIALGDRVRVNMDGVTVTQGRITIGDDTLIGEYVSIRDANHGVASGDLIRTQTAVVAEISVGCDV